MIEGNTNVLSSRFGGGCVTGLGRELGRFAVATMPVPWQLVQGSLEAEPEAVVFVESLEEEVIERQLNRLPPCETVVGVGGGQAIDLAKYLAWRTGRRLVTIPTVISVDAFVTPKAAVRRKHQVDYVGFASPDPLVIDYELIRTAPRGLNIAGTGDLLSIQTACRDWELALEAGRSEYPYSEDDVVKARAVLESIYGNAAAIRDLADEGIRLLVEGYMRVNTICLPAGHYRVEEGSEHFLFYELEERLRRAFIHGQIVGLGIFIMSRLQCHEHERVVALMDLLGLGYQPRDLGIDRSTLVASLLNLKEYTQRRGLWYSVIQSESITREWVEETLDLLQF